MKEEFAALALEAAGSPVVGVRRFAGGDISGASLLTLADGNRCVAKTGPMVPVEARMLQAMARSNTPIPKVLACEGNVMLIEYLPSSGALAGAAWPALAEALSALYQCQSDQYGWTESYALLHVKVENETATNWPDFWAERRLLCHIPHIEPGVGHRIENLCASLTDLLPRNPTPSLLHGDLWGGNVLVESDQISGLIDPCAYYGDREVDAASLTVFDNPPEEFFEALFLQPGWHARFPIYRLWMWLMHVRLFGNSYYAAVERELRELGF